MRSKYRHGANIPPSPLQGLQRFLTARSAHPSKRTKPLPNRLALNPALVCRIAKATIVLQYKGSVDLQAIARGCVSHRPTQAILGQDHRWVFPPLQSWVVT